LPAEKLAELAQTDELELLYLHLQSMRNFRGLRDRLAVTEGGKASEGTEPGVAAATPAGPADGAVASSPSGEPWGGNGDGRAAAE
jgi:hypothetical protein